MVSLYISKEQPKGFADGLDEEYEKRMTERFFGQNDWVESDAIYPSGEHWVEMRSITLGRLCF